MTRRSDSTDTDELRAVTDPDTESGKVLVVDDDPYLTGMYSAMLEDVHTVYTATGTENALDQLTDDFDVVLLDRRMPVLSGDDMLDIIRNEGYDCRVAMVTAVDPDLDIVELPFDAYVVKPVRQRDLRELVSDLLLRSQYSSGIQELCSITSKLAALRSQFDEEELHSHEQYRELLERKEQLETMSRERMVELVERGDTGLAFRDVLGTVSHQ